MDRTSRPIRGFGLLVALLTVGCGARRPPSDAFVVADAVPQPHWAVVRGSFSLTGHAATRLQDGTVLLVGGYDFRSARRVSTTVRFDPADDRLRPDDTMTFARRAHRALLLEDGRLLVLGGNSWEGPRPEPLGLHAEVYDPQAASGARWRPLPNPPRPLGYSSGGALQFADGRVCCVYCSGSLVEPATVLDELELTNETWRTVGSAKAPWHATAVLTDDGNVLVVGGNAAFPGAAAITRIDVQTGEVEAAGLELAMARDNAAVVRRGPQSYWVIGGWETPGQPSTADSVERIDLGHKRRSLITLDDAAYHDVRALPLASGDVLLFGASTEGLGITVGLLDAGGAYRRIARLPYEAESLTATLLLDGSVLLAGDLRPSAGGAPGAALRFYPAP